MDAMTPPGHDSWTPAALAREAIDQLNPDHARIALGRQRVGHVWAWREQQALPILLTGLREPPPNDPDYPFRRFDHGQQFYDRDKMLFEAVWPLLDAQSPAAWGDSEPAIRANFGVVLVPSCFGVAYEVLSHTLPWIRQHLSKQETAQAIRTIDPATIPQRGIMPRALDYAAYFKTQMGDRARVTTSHNQSPFDIAHLIRGDDLFYDLYDDPSFVHDLMEACTEAYIAVAHAFEDLLGNPPDGLQGEKAFSDMPRVSCADDSATLLGPQQFEEFGLPYARRAMAEFGGGVVHFCGNGKHILRGYLAAPEVRGINLGQPELYDPAQLMPMMLDSRKVYAGSWPILPGEALDGYIDRILSPLGGRHQGMILGLDRYQFGILPEQVAARWYQYQQQG
ncbi:MAG: hypothetical protein FJ280_17705 [Planctomycetes bacterium]|nr:hypothetical protein [Planctomycetota bacterium]